MRKYFRRCLIGFIVSFPSLISIAQINGTITDTKTGKPLHGVEVFIKQTTSGALCDDAGQFTVENAPAGFHELVLYALYRSP
jgi:hypothetical protein